MRVKPMAEGLKKESIIPSKDCIFIGCYLSKLDANSIFIIRQVVFVCKFCVSFKPLKHILL